MKSLQEISQNRLFNIEQTTRELLKHPKHKYLDEFHRRINRERISDGYKPLRKSAIAVKIAHLSEQDLDFLFKKCAQSLNFSKVFFGLLKLDKTVTHRRN